MQSNEQRDTIWTLFEPYSVLEGKVTLMMKNASFNLSQHCVLVDLDNFWRARWLLHHVLLDRFHVSSWCQVSSCWILYCFLCVFVYFLGEDILSMLSLLASSMSLMLHWIIAVYFSSTGISLVCPPNTCVLVCQQWWATCLLISMPTSPTPPPPPQPLPLLLTDLLPLTLE